MKLKLSFTVLILVALSSELRIQCECAIIPPLEDRIPVFENIVQNNASTIVVNGERQTVEAIAGRTYTVPGTGRQIIFMSNADFERFSRSLPGGGRGEGANANVNANANANANTNYNWQGFRRRLEPPVPQPRTTQAPLPRAEPYAHYYGSNDREFQTQPVSSPVLDTQTGTGQILSSASSLQLDSSSAWTTPTPAPTRGRAQAPSLYSNSNSYGHGQNRESQYRGNGNRHNNYNYNYGQNQRQQYATSPQMEAVYTQPQPQPQRFQQRATTEPVHSRDRAGVREREPYENVLGLHRHGVQHYNRESESIPDDLLRYQASEPRPVQPSRLRTLDNNRQDDVYGYAEGREREREGYDEGYAYTPGYRRYSDYALGGRGAEYRAAPAPPPSAHAPAPLPEQIHDNYYTPRPDVSVTTSTTEADTRSPYDQYQYQPTPTPTRAPGSGGRSKCCVVTWTCMLINGYNYNGERYGYGGLQQQQQPPKRICGPRQMTTTPRPTDIAPAPGGDRTQKCCCCCCVVQCC